MAEEASHDWRTPDQVRKGLFLSSSDAEKSLETLKAAGITHILQAAAGIPQSHPDKFTYLSLPLYDKEFADAASHFPAACKFIDDAIGSGGNVLVHCQAGVSRAPCLVAAYLISKEGMSVADAVAATREARWGVLPNPGFLCQLMEYEQLRCDLSGWEGWGYDRWLAHPLAPRAMGLYQQLLGLRQPEGEGEQGDGGGPGVAQVASVDAGDEEEQPDEGAQEALRELLGQQALTTDCISPFATSGAAAAAAGDE